MVNKNSHTHIYDFRDSGELQSVQLELNINFVIDSIIDLIDDFFQILAPKTEKFKLFSIK